MTQHELNQAVARATGESVETIAAIGFSLEQTPVLLNDPITNDDKPNVSDIDKSMSQPPSILRASGIKPAR